MTYTHKQLVEIAYEWVIKNASCGVAFKELSCATPNGEIPDVIGFGNMHSVLVEVKISRPDFISDKKKPFRIKPEFGMGKERYYCCPEGVIKVEDLPAGWGLVVVNNIGKAKCIYKPKVPNPNYEGHFLTYYHKRNIEAEHALMYSALRRLHLRGRIDDIYIGLVPATPQENIYK